MSTYRWVDDDDEDVQVTPAPVGNVLGGLANNETVTSGLSEQ